MSCKDCGHENITGARFCAGCGNPLALEGPAGEDPFIGQVVGDRYRVVRRIGEGGMGVVYQAEQKLGSTVRKVAVKTLHAELSQDASITARFHREVGTVASLEHPNTVRVYDFGSTEDGTLYIAMEFLNGVPLQNIIEKNGPLDATRVAHILKQVAGSLDEAHNKGIVHRDLKPDNVLLIERAGEPDVVKLVDFGIAARTESADAKKEQKLTQQGMVLGTPPYMSPEQFTGKSVDGRSDIYSLGVMTYEMLTGQLPFQAETAWQWATHHMTSKPKDFSELPHGAKVPEIAQAAVMKALSKQPEDRQPNAGAFFNDFQLNSGGASKGTRPKTAAVADGYQATQAMEEMPVMQGVAATQAMPELAGPVSPAPAVVSPRAKQPEKNHSLVYGLAGLGGVLLVAMAVVASQGDGDSPATLPAAAVVPATSPGPSVTAPETDLTAELETPPSVDPPSKPPAKPAGKAAGSGKKKSKRPAAAAKAPVTKTPATKTPAQPKPRTTPAPKPPRAQIPPPPIPAAKPKPRPAAKAPGKQDACRVCIAAVSKKDLLTAGRSYGQCGNSRQKAKCRAKATQVAPKLATQQAYNGKCAEARAIMAAAQQMGVPASRFSKAKKECK